MVGNGSDGVCVSSDGGCACPGGACAVCVGSVSVCSVVGYWLPEAGYWLPEAGYWLPEAGYWLGRVRVPGVRPGHQGRLPGLGQGRVLDADHGEPAERQRPQEQDQYAGAGEKAEPFQELPGRRGERPDRARQRSSRADRDVDHYHPGDRDADDEPGSARRGEQRAEAADRPVRGGGHQQAADQRGRAGHDRQPQPARGIRPRLVRRVGEAEIRADERGQAAPGAQQDQQHPAHAAATARNPGHACHSPHSLRNRRIKTRTSWVPAGRPVMQSPGKRANTPPQAAANPPHPAGMVALVDPSDRA